MSTWKTIKFDPYISPCIKIISKSIKDLNLKTKTLQLLDEKIDSTLKFIGL